MTYLIFKGTLVENCLWTKFLGKNFLIKAVVPELCMYENCQIFCQSAISALTSASLEFGKEKIFNTELVFEIFILRI